MVKKIKKPVDEKEDYENFLGKRSEEYEPATLGEFIGEENKTKRDWEEHWVGMPEFENEENKSYKKITVTFRNKADYEEFQKLIGQKLTEKTKSIWHPALDKTANSLLRWVEVDND